MSTIAGFFASAAAVAALLSQASGEVIPPVRTSFDSVELTGVATDHMRFEVRANVTSIRNVTVTRVEFHDMRLGSIPFYLSPIDQTLHLKTDQATPLPPLTMTLYFRDLDSLEPLEDAIRAGRIAITGGARTNLDLSLMERIVARQWSGRGQVPIESNIPIVVPGGVPGKTAALLAVHTAQSALEMAGSALNKLQLSQKVWTAEIYAEYAQSVVLAESRFRMIFKGGQSLDISTRGLGLRISHDTILVTGELVEPWKYDPEMAVLLERREAAIAGDHRDLLVWPGDAHIEDSAALSNSKLQIERVGSKIEKTLVPFGDRNVTVHLAKRDTDSNYALLRVTEADDARKTMEGTESEAGQSWDRVALFHIEEGERVNIIFIPARRQDDRLVFDTPVDEGAFGSPVITPDGVVGMVQDEHSGMVFRDSK